MLRPWEFNIEIDHNSDVAIYMQLADAIIAAIKNGQLPSGEALPGSRLLAEQLQLNRNTVVEALNVLLAEGWLVSKERRGTFVADSLPSFKKVTASKQRSPTLKSPQSPIIVFDDGLPDIKLAPMKELARAYRQLFSQQGRWLMMGYTCELGDIKFRQAIVKMLNFKRGMQVFEDEVCITRGSQMAMYLASQCLFKKGDVVVVENPGYKPASLAFESAGASLLPLPIDSDGLIIATLEKQLKKQANIRAVYITPHHQFPTTVTLSLQRRLELVALSNQYGFTIIEDDYDNEFHFGQRPIMPVSSYAKSGSYIYIGTMSKIVAPALRTGYLVASPDFIAKIGQLRKIVDVQGDNIMERAVFELIQQGEIKRHLKRAHATYKAKRDVFDEMLSKYVGNKISYTKPEGGLAYWITPNKPTDLDKLMAALTRAGVQIISPGSFSYGTAINGLRLGYASLSEESMETGLKKLGKLL